MRNKKMSRDKKVRFLKLVMLYSIAMATAVTAAAIAIGWVSREMPSGTVAALGGMWSIELTLGAFIKTAEGKEQRSTKKKNENGEDSI